MHSFQFFASNSVGQLIDPWCLQFHSGSERFLSFFCQGDELRATVMWIVLEFDEPLLAQVIDDPLDVLPVAAQIASQPSHRLRAFCRDYSV